MKLTRGEHTDSLLVNQPEETWRSARNLVWDRDSLRVEEGFQNYTITVSGTTYTVISELFLPDESLLMFVVSDVSSSIILQPYGDYNTTYQISNYAYNFDVRYPIRAKARYTNNLDIEVVFTDNYNPPRRITIDRSTSPYVILEDSLDKTKLFPDIGIPNFDLLSVNSGGFLEKGSYYVTIAYNFGDDSYTNWIGMSNQVVLESNGSGFTMQFTDLDIDFDSFKIGLIRASGDNIINAYETTINYSISSSTKIVTITGSTRAIELADITVKSLSYNRISDYEVIDNRLYAANLTRDAVVDYQSYANNIRIEPIYEDLVALDSPDGSYSDPIIIFDKTGFQDDEVYAFYIRLHLKDGTPAGDFFIPSQGYNGMGIHTNTSEEYPLNKNYPAGNVRHHVFPRKAASDFLSGSLAGSDPDDIITSGTDSKETITTDVMYGVKFGTPSGNLGTIGNDATYAVLTNNTITFSEALIVTVTFDYSLTCTTTVAGNESIDLIFYVFKNNGDLRYSDVYNVSGDTTYTLTGSSSVDITVAPGDTISFQGLADINTGDGADVGALEANWQIAIKGLIPSTDANYFTKPTGIKVTNIVIPQEIADKIDRYEILYAARNGSNSRVLGQSVAFPEDWRADEDLVEDGKVRFHAFDILLNKPRIYPSHIRGQINLTETELISASKADLLGTPSGSTYESAIVQGKYIPANNIAASNEDGEEHYGFLTSTGVTIAANKRLLVNLVAAKTDYYIGFETQILQSTGVVHTISGPGTYSINKLYGGDTYTCLYDIRLTKKRPEGATDSYIRNYKIPCQSRFNISLRDWGQNWWEQAELVYPPSSEYEALQLDDTTLIGLTYQEKQLLRSDYTKRYSNYFEYDEGLSFGNKFIQAKIQGDTESDYFFRIIRSREQDLESQISSWRSFLPNDYYEQNKDRGIINNLGVIDTDKLIIHHTNGLFITSAKEKLAASATEIIIGSGDIFDRKPKEAIYTTHGTLGSKHKFANFTCEMGYIFISRGRIYSLSGELKDLTPGNSRFFFDNLDTGDNPYLQNKASQYYVGGISMAYDREYDRLLIAVNRASSSYTKSYSKVNGWTANHDYVDCKLFNTNEKPYSLNYNSTLGKSKLYEHNAGNRATYYDGVVYDSSISIVANAQPDLDKMFHNVSWKLTDLAINKNFKTIKVTTDTNDTGEITLIPFTDIFTEYNVRKMLSTWYFNKLSVNGGSLGTAYPISGLYGLIELKLDNTDQEDAAIIDIDYDYQIIDPQ